MGKDFKVGDVVCIISGGPLMTVNSVGEPETVECIWFDKNDFCAKMEISRAVLEKTDMPDSKIRK